MPKLNEKKLSFFRWRQIPEVERSPSTFKEKARELGVRAETLTRWNGEYPAWLGKEVRSNGIDISNLSEEEQIKLFDKLLFKLALDPKAPTKNRELFGKRYGLFVEKQEVKIELNAEQLAREHLESRRWLKEHGYLEETGMGEVQPKPPLLFEALRNDTPPETGNNQVERVAPSSLSP